MNEELLQQYNAAFPNLLEIAAQSERVNWPLLLDVPAGYSSLPEKLMIVGQETRGWGKGPLSDVSLERVVAEYRGFDLGARYRSTPFWQGSHDLHRLVNPGVSQAAFLWSNLIKVSQRKTRPEPHVEEAVCKLELLRREIEITQPDAIVFFTGPKYDGRLRATFPGVSIDKLSKFVGRVKHPSLPHHTYRTYHPGYLRRSKNWQVMEELAGYIASRG